jgi:hypothetical protein
LDGWVRTLQKNHHNLTALQEQEQQRLIQAEQEDAIEEASRQEADSSTTPWLQFTQWPTQFAHRPLAILVATTVIPRGSDIDDYLLGRWEGHDLISLQSDELRLHHLVQAFDQVSSRCLDTLKDTSEQFRCWIKTLTIVGFFPEPFQILGRAQTFSRYSTLWKRFLCFVFRTWRIEEVQRNQIYGIQFSSVQKDLIAEVWRLLNSDLKPEEVKESQDIGEEESEDESDCRFQKRTISI